MKTAYYMLANKQQLAAAAAAIPSPSPLHQWNIITEHVTKQFA